MRLSNGPGPRSLMLAAICLIGSPPSHAAQSMPEVKASGPRIAAALASLPHSPDETWISASIAARLALKQGPDSARIKVEADGRTVTLTGKVLDQHQKSQALHIAGDTPGVRQIVDLMQVIDPPVSRQSL